DHDEAKRDENEEEQKGERWCEQKRPRCGLCPSRRSSLVSFHAQKRYGCNVSEAMGFASHSARLALRRPVRLDTAAPSENEGEEKVRHDRDSVQGGQEH